MISIFGGAAISHGRVFFVSTGAVYALDAKSGCTYWIFRAESGIRTAISLGANAVYFSDAKANAYAVDIATNGGEALWAEASQVERAFA
jgi:polyvinyl alcohol dehydrogenase (cytochrome)